MTNRQWLEFRKPVRGLILCRRLGSASSEKRRKVSLSWNEGKFSGHRAFNQEAVIASERRHFTSSATTLAQAIITSHLDYCNCLIPTYSLLTSCPLTYFSLPHPESCYNLHLIMLTPLEQNPPDTRHKCHNTHGDLFD